MTEHKISPDVTLSQPHLKQQRIPEKKRLQHFIGADNFCICVFVLMNTHMQKEKGTENWAQLLSNSLGKSRDVWFSYRLRQPEHAASKETQMLVWLHNTHTCFPLAYMLVVLFLQYKDIQVFSLKLISACGYSMLLWNLQNTLCTVLL